MTNPDVPGITDGRRPGEYFSHYPCDAWAQIVAELLFLIAIVVAGLSFLFVVGYDLAGRKPDQVGTIAIYFQYPKHRTFLIWTSIAFAGSIGGATFALKWLYHSVAKSLWNRDRVLWRVTVPIISGVLSLFLAFMIVSGIVPFFSRTAFDNYYVALGFGFFTGYFSDNVLAALQRLALKTFGTVDAPPHSEAQEKE